MGMIWFCEPPGGLAVGVSLQPGKSGGESIGSRKRTEAKVGLRWAWRLEGAGPELSVQQGRCRKRACVGNKEEPKRGRIDKIPLLYKLDLLL